MTETSARAVHGLANTRVPDSIFATLVRIMIKNRIDAIKLPQDAFLILNFIAKRMVGSPTFYLEMVT